MRDRTITKEEADDYFYGDNIATQMVSEHRWYNKRLVVFKDADESLWGFYYLDPASESQEGQDRYESDPVEVFPVVAAEVTQTIYEPAQHQEGER